MNGKNPYNYPVNLHRKSGKPFDDLTKLTLLPYHWLSYSVPPLRLDLRGGTE